MDYRKLAEEQQDYVVKMRRYFHENPELSAQEENTVKVICEELKKDGIPYVNVPKGGVFGFVGDEAKGRTVLLRADIDALPVKESPVNGGGKPKTVISKIEGKAHMCGHDSHAAMLLGAARILKEHENELPGRVILMFERGEEGGGNLAWLLKYAFENHYKVDSSFGMHVFPYVPAGKIAALPGVVMAGPMGFSVKLTGKSSHGSEPNKGNNPLDCFVAIYNTMNSMRMKYANPYDAMVFSVCQVHSGTANNIIPAELTFGGSFRCYNFDDATRIHDKLIETFEETAKIYGCKVEYSVTAPGLGLYNDPECTAFGQNVLKQTFGDDILYDMKPLMGSESHAMTSRIWPGVFLYLGIGNKEKGTTATNHDECFDIDEDAMQLGVASHVAYVFEFLRNGPDTSDRVYTGNIKDFYEKYNPRALVAYEDK